MPTKAFTNGSPATACDHTVQFYDDDEYLLDSVASYVGDGFDVGETAVVILTSDHLDGLNARLVLRGFDLPQLKSSNRYITVDATETLPMIMNGEEPDQRRFVEIVGTALSVAASGQRPIRAFGELVALLARQNNHAAAVRLEQYWNELQASIPFSLLCAYPINVFSSQDFLASMTQVCDEHSAIIPAESYSSLINEDDRSREIAVLQQKAARLEAEVSRRMKAEESLRVALHAEQAARLEAETALGLRDDFLTIAAHDLRTPVTVLSGHAQIIVRQLQRDNYVEQERLLDAVDEIAEQAINLTALVDQLLDTSRLEAGIMTIERRSVDIAALARNVVASRQKTTEAHVISSTAPKHLAATVDPLRIKQVLNNLLDNAVKYSPDGSAIDVDLSRCHDGSLEISVRDYGIGIPDDMRDQIFERFHQAHGDRYRSGLGLGLFITRQIVELHGGSIDVESPPDGGSRFVVNLPPHQTDDSR